MDNKQRKHKIETEIITYINKLSGGRSPYEIFCEWVECMALAISNAADLSPVSEKREARYLEIARAHPECIKIYPEMMYLLTIGLENEIYDMLGSIYMRSGMGNKNTGQFFTPYHISKACAQMALSNMEFGNGGKIRLNEPSCGGGGMLIAVADILKERGINYQRVIEAVAQDLDWKAVYMCYVQLSLIGVSGIVVQGDTLTNPFVRTKDYPPEQVFITPAKKGLLWRI